MHNRLANLLFISRPSKKPTTMACMTYMLILISLIFSCKKDKSDYAEDELRSPRTGSRMELTLDSIFLYSRQVYLWRQSLPSYTAFDPRGRYGSIVPELRAYQNELYDITQLSKDPSGRPYEWAGIEQRAKYSYLERIRAPSSSERHASIGLTNFVNHLQFWDMGTAKVAYLYLSSFPDLAKIRSELDGIFEHIQQRAVTHLIVDLRHNGGGFINSAVYLANLIAPDQLNGKTMFVEQFNEEMQNGKARILRKQVYRDANGKTVHYQGRLATMADVDYSEKANTQLYAKQGNFNSVQKLYFIVSGRTASASELLISSFKPYIPLKLIGQKTYGKPVGFFPIQIDNYRIYLASFLLKNAAGWSDYFDGIPVDIPINDTLTDNQQIGQPEEKMLAAALHDIASGNHKMTPKQTFHTTKTISGSSPTSLIKKDYYLLPPARE
ncbi:S41 family peptidase [Sphingobacterium paludis]|uniref:Peptidase S41-like protein n=1 Tax=Sphingobacterium paludis TaxID=1476465 RepID=A0A4R7CUH5_9SPHI|nr:S41 family peptidase [Sphingobacterium paludis]TDS07469.1 peptidase S41-like protein [Sphingobacterium paludis]